MQCSKIKTVAQLMKQYSRNIWKRIIPTILGTYPKTHLHHEFHYTAQKENTF